MVPKFALLANLLLASAALAAPSWLESRLARRGENHQSQPLNRADPPTDTSSDVVYFTNWAGAIWERSIGAFTRTTGTFTVPKPSGSSGSGATVWVGISSHTCGKAVLQTGVELKIGADESVSYSAWCQWWPAQSFYRFSDITISAGDVINATVIAESTTSGVAILENITTGKRVTHSFSSQPTLCERRAEWIVGDYDQGSGLAPFANFSSVTFYEATASGPSGSFTPSGATILDIEQNDQVLTSVSVNGNNLTITYK